MKSDIASDIIACIEHLKVHGQEPTEIRMSIDTYRRFVNHFSHNRKVAGNAAQNRKARRKAARIYETIAFKKFVVEV